MKKESVLKLKGNKTILNIIKWTTIKAIYHNKWDTKVTEKIITKNGKYLEKLTKIKKKTN